jgi:hypothetical protein
MVMTIEAPHESVETVWATPTHELVPDIFYAKEWLPPMLGGYKNGQRVKVNIGESPFFRSDRVFGDWDTWQRKLSSMSYWLEIHEPPVRRLNMEEDLQGKQLGYAKANAHLLKERVILGSEMRELVAFAQEKNNPMGMRMMAKNIANSLVTKEELRQNLEINKIEAAWRKVRQSLKYGPIVGADALEEAIRIETNETHKQKLIHARHRKNKQLADLLLQKRTTLLHPLSYDSRSYLSRHISIDIDFDEIFGKLAELYRQNVHTDVKLEEPSVTIDTDFLWGLGKMMHQEDLADLVKIRFSQSGARCYSLKPPYDVVAAFDSERGFSGAVTKLHEIGHAKHRTNADDQLPYVLRLSSSVWSETLAMYQDGTAYVPGILGTNDNADTLERARLQRALGSLASCIVRVQWEKWFYDDTSDVTIQSASEKYATYINAMGWHIDSPLEWANDMYLGEYEWYCINYVVAFIAVEQLCAYATKHFGGPFTPEAAWWLHQKCFWPGGALDWQDLLQHATGEEFNPQYFFDALEKAGLSSK